MAKSIKNYSEFVKETDVVGHDEVTATKPATLSEKLKEKFNECMAMAVKEAEDWHKDEYKEHTAEGWCNECDSYLKECMESLKKECESFGIQGGPNRPDGDMRQGNMNV